MPSRYNTNGVLIWKFIGRLEIDPTSSSAAMLSLSAVVRLHVFSVYLGGYEHGWWWSDEGCIPWVSELRHDPLFLYTHRNIACLIWIVPFCSRLLNCCRHILFEKIREAWSDDNIREGRGERRGRYIFLIGVNSSRILDRSRDSILTLMWFLKSLILSKPLLICCRFYFHHLQWWYHNYFQWFLTF